MSKLILIETTKLKDDGDCNTIKNCSKIRINKKLKGWKKLETEFHETTHANIHQSPYKITTRNQHKIIKILELIFIELCQKYEIKKCIGNKKMIS